MDSPRTSEPKWWFIDVEGRRLDVPVEWTPAWIEVDIALNSWEQVRADIHGRAVTAEARRIGDSGRVVVPWDRAGAGRYTVRVSVGNGPSLRTFTIAPAKLRQDELDQIVGEIETRLAPAIALQLQTLCAFAGLTIHPPGDQTLAAELQRLRAAVLGDGVDSGLETLIPTIARDPHATLRTKEPWVPTQFARRPARSRLGTAYARANNVDEARLPLAVLDSRVDRTVDVYENQLLKLFTAKVERRLRIVARASTSQPAAVEAAELLRTLGLAQRRAPFLQDVSTPHHALGHVSMVLLKRPEYRATLSAFRRYMRHVTVELDDPAADAPLDDVPHLYELWASLRVLEETLGVADEQGLRIETNAVVRRSGEWLTLTTNDASVTLRNPADGTRLAVRLQPSYGTASSPLHSITFTQIPDISIERLTLSGEHHVLILDPKYKLRGPEENEVGEEIFPGRPVKTDIDKMHAYRDAIRDSQDRHAVGVAAILYPGPTRWYSDDLAAIRCRPGGDDLLTRELRQLIRSFMQG